MSNTTDSQFEKDIKQIHERFAENKQVHVILYSTADRARIIYAGSKQDIIVLLHSAIKADPQIKRLLQYALID